MTDGFVLGPGQGERVSPAMTLKVGDKNSKAWSMFEVVDIGPGFDVGAHLHRNAEEPFYVLEGQLDLLAFEPRVRTPGNWQSWQPHTGATVARGEPGSMMYVPRGCPHAFANPGPGPARMIFLVSPSFAGAGAAVFVRRGGERLRQPADVIDQVAERVRGAGRRPAEVAITHTGDEVGQSPRGRPEVHHIHVPADAVGARTHRAARHHLARASAAVSAVATAPVRIGRSAVGCRCMVPRGPNALTKVRCSHSARR